MQSYASKYGGAVILQETYTRDAVGRIQTKTETVDGQTHVYTYTYDPTGRLTDVLTDGQASGHWEYDNNGNRIEGSSPIGPLSGVYDDQDRLHSYGAQTFEYTDAGELLTKTDSSGVTHYTYDVLGNLREVELPDGTLIEYLIDGANRRIGKKVNGTLIKGWLWSGLSIVAELNGSGQMLSRFVPGGMVKNGTLYKIIRDHLGSPRVVVNASTGQVVQRMDYDEWGNVTLDTAPGFQPQGFAGGLWDPDSALLRFGARDYDPWIGRWTLKDPIGFGGGQVNLYGYCINDPINFVDPEGLYIIQPGTYHDRIESAFELLRESFGCKDGKCESCECTEKFSDYGKELFDLLQPGAPLYIYIQPNGPITQMGNYVHDEIAPKIFINRIWIDKGFPSICDIAQQILHELIHLARKDTDHRVEDRDFQRKCRKGCIQPGWAQ